MASDSASSCSVAKSFRIFTMQGIVLEGGVGLDGLLEWADFLGIISNLLVVKMSCHESARRVTFSG